MTDLSTTIRESNGYIIVLYDDTGEIAGSISEPDFYSAMRTVKQNPGSVMLRRMTPKHPEKWAMRA